MTQVKSPAPNPVKIAPWHVLDLAMIRDDGWPQTTTDVNTGFTLFVATGAHAQKVLNIRANQRVSPAIHNGGADWSQLQGLSLAATAEVMSWRADILHVARLVKKKFPSLEPLSDPERDRGWAFLRIVPHIISVIDYTKGFGHTVLAKLKRVFAGLALSLGLLPPAAGQVPPYVTGGIGAAERETLLSYRDDFSLQLVFAARGTGHYLAGVEVRILDEAGVQLLRAVSEGPFFFVQLPPGDYTVLAAYAGIEQTHRARIAPQGPARLHLYWNDPQA